MTLLLDQIWALKPQIMLFFFFSVDIKIKIRDLHDLNFSFPPWCYKKDMQKLKDFTHYEIFIQI